MQPQPRSSSDKSEATLLARLADGDRRAAEVLVERTYGDVYAALMLTAFDDGQIDGCIRQFEFRGHGLNCHSVRSPSRKSSESCDIRSPMYPGGPLLHQDSVGNRPVLRQREEIHVSDELS